MKATISRRIVAACLLASTYLGAAAVASEAPKVTLRVALFPYIPDSGNDDFKGLAARLESTFEKRNPNIDLLLRPLNDSEDFYDVDMLKSWLTGNGADAYDVVEIDTVVLGDLATAGVIAPWASAKSNDWHPAASSAVRLNNAVYGIPRLLCGHFLVTRTSAVANAKDIDQLSASLKALPGNKSLLIGNLLGSWNMPSLYLDAWVDSHVGSSPAYALHAFPDLQVLKDFKKFASLCTVDGKNPCLDGTYDKGDHSEAIRFANGEAGAMLGYSESLYYVLSSAPDDTTVQITPAQMGHGKYPLLFTDAFVLRRGVPGEIQVAANAFAAFMTSPDIQEMVAMSGDVSATTTPRYILPATLSAFDAPRVRKNRLYQSLRRSISKATSFPNTGFLNTRKAVRDEIKKSLEQ